MRSNPLTQPTQTTQRPTFHGSGAVAFSTKGEYGVRLMVQLGRHSGTGPASLADVAAEEDLPRAYLAQLVTSLRDSRLVFYTTGAPGGHALGGHPGETRVRELADAREAQATRVKRGSPVRRSRSRWCRMRLRCQPICTS